MGQLALGVVGAAAGFVLSGGNPAGAMIGFELGSMIGGMLFNSAPKTPQLGDLKVQNSAYGQPIPLLYGSWRVAGNIIWSGIPVEYTQEHSGKGGASAPSTYGYKLSFAVALCEGVIETVPRIWANGTLIYDVTDPTDFTTVSGSNNQVTGFVVYPGDENQTADPTMEAALGVGNVPPNRGVAYVVFNQFDLAPYNNIIPSFSFEVIKSTGNATFGVATVPGAFFAMTYQQGNGGKGFQTLTDPNAPFGFLIYQYSVTPYGVFTDAVSSDSPENLGGVLAGISYDDYGVLLSNGIWMADGVTQFNAGYAVGLQDFESSDCRWVKKNGIIYLSVVAINTDAVQLLQDGASQATFGNPAHFYAVIGATDDWLYIIDITTTTLIQVSLDFMTSNALLTDPSIATYTAYVENDLSIYFFSGSSIIHWDGSVLSTIISFGLGIGLCSTMWKVAQSFYLVQNSAIASPYPAGLLIVTPVAQPAETLADVISDICTRSALTSSQFDVTAISGIDLVGFAVTQHSSARDSITQLLQIYNVDVSDSGGVLKFVPRTGTPVATIPWEDLGASTSETDDAATNPLPRVIALETSLPRTFALTFADINLDYNTNTVTAFKGTTRSNLDSAIAIAAAFSDAEALMRAQVQLWSAWLSRTTYALSTSMQYIYLDPTDVVNIQDDTGVYRIVRMQSCNYDGKGMLTWAGVADSANIYPSASYAAAGAPAIGFNTQTIGYAGPTLLRVLDIPPLQNTDTAPGLYLAACGYASNWPGAGVEISRDDTTFTSAALITKATAQGIATTALGNWLGGHFPDEQNTVTVQLYEGTLSSVAYATFLNQAQAALIGNEIILFRTATELSANVYQLNGLLRGMIGTEFAQSTHAANERFVYLDPTTLQQVLLNIADLGTTMYFLPQTQSAAALDSTTPVTSTTNVARVKPLSPVLFNAFHGSTASVTDITLRWIRRARVNAQWLDGADVPLDESVETYSVAISNSSGVVLRTLTVTGPFTGGVQPNTTYTAAMITADGFTTGNVISFAVQQHSDQGVLGYAATTSIAR